MICEEKLPGLEQEVCNTPMNVMEVGAVIQSEREIVWICPRCGVTQKEKEFIPPRVN